MVSVSPILNETKNLNITNMINQHQLTNIKKC